MTALFFLLLKKHLIQPVTNLGLKLWNVLVLEMFNNVCSSCVKLAHGSTPRFNICRGITQGCPLSLFLFLLVIQIMAVPIKNRLFQDIPRTALVENLN